MDDNICFKPECNRRADYHIYGRAIDGGGPDAVGACFEHAVDGLNEARDMATKLDRERLSKLKSLAVLAEKAPTGGWMVTSPDYHGLIQVSDSLDKLHDVLIPECMDALRNAGVVEMPKLFRLTVKGY